ncbi:cation-translocating P-type ATPase [Anaerolineae bacterium CFX9]|nr:cation-translocating P-type ATPase [Anaerolineae bacterium CFX9]
MDVIVTTSDALLTSTASPAWHTRSAQETLQQLAVSSDAGLTSGEAAARQAQHGPNELVEKKGRSVWSILREQLVAPLVLLLLFAAAISAVLGKADSVIAILAIVILNAVLGVVQEYRAERAMAALKKMSAPLVRVRREGKLVDIASRDLVPGDIVLLEAGSIVPADSRLIEAANLRALEASLTGESQAVDKSTASLDDADLPLGDRVNMVYMGTSVTYGRGSAVVVETGMRTQLGRIAELIQSVDDEKTPLQRRMDELGGVLIRAALIVMGIAFVVGLITGQPIFPDAARPEAESVLLNAVAIAVAVVPEGLPAVVTIALALGAQRMLRRKALIRKLPAVETLGSVTTICSDKTGTLTENRMTVTIVDISGQTVQMEALSNGQRSLTHEMVLLTGTLCNDSELEAWQDGSTFKAVGDPTEAAMVVAGARVGLIKSDLERAFPRVAEAPFDSDRKRMTTAHRVTDSADVPAPLARVRDAVGAQPGQILEFSKGAVDSLLEVSSGVWMDEKVVPLTPELRQRILSANDALAQDGLRVLGTAYRVLDGELPSSPDALEADLVFIGMIGMIDPPRAEVKEAVRVCKEAGIRPVMITGDHPLTALAIANELGIVSPGARVLTGHELNKMSIPELEGVVEDVSVYARVSPEHKLNIVQALQRKGHITAMTGDGVNDAPALKRSNIGVAMGITGTAVSKEASDMVIIDDNFATIVSAVEEGRTIYDNVRRFIKYLLASNTGELFVLLATQLIAGMTIPLTTLQILWMNLITDGIPALALGVESAEKGAMTRPPYAPTEKLFGRGLGRHILLVGLIFGVIGVALGYWAWSSDLRAANGEPAWNTMVFIFLTIAQMGHAYGLRSHRETVFSLNFFGNKLLLGAIAVTIVLQMIAIYTPFFNAIFNTNPLTLEQLLICFLLSTVVFWIVELEKVFIRRGKLSS